MRDILHASALPVQTDLDIDPVSEADRKWWAEFTGSSEWWADLGADTVVDCYGECPLHSDDDDDDDDDEIIDRFLANHGYEPEPPDEFYRWGGHPG